MPPVPSLTRQPFHVMAKPIGPVCNLDCTYCFYLEKERLHPKGHDFRMSDATLETFVRQYIESQDAAEITFAWQGGEPTLLGVDFFRRAVALQQKYANGRKIANAIQTNATRLDEEWGAFLHEQGFLVGVSVDGPAPLHDAYRVNKGGGPTFDTVMRGLDVLRRHQVEFNTLTVVNRLNSKQPLEVYRFLKEVGSGFMQFIPLVERKPLLADRDFGWHMASPPSPEDPSSTGEVTPWSLEAPALGDFLVPIFDEWVRHDVGRIFVQIFDVTLGNHMKLGAGLCVFAKECGRALAIEHNGDLFSCDHYVYPEHRLGSLHERPLAEMVESEAQRAFGRAKFETLPAFCRRCEVLDLCHGECPKHRFARTPDGEAGLNYLCPSYKRFFGHVRPFMERMAQLLRAGRAPAEIMGEIHASDRARRFQSAERNDPCPCGSGKKFKLCCGDK